MAPVPLVVWTIFTPDGKVSLEAETEVGVVFGAEVGAGAAAMAQPASIALDNKVASVVKVEFGVFIVFGDG